MPVEHFRQHPDVHQPWAEWAEDSVLHVAAAYSNPFRWRTRRELANDFRRHMAASPNVVLHVGELAYGDRPFEVTDPSSDPNDVQLRGRDILFQKENVLNLVIKTFPPDCRFGAVIDMDWHFTRHDWALEAIAQLSIYEWTQLFSSYADLSDNSLDHGQHVVRTNPSFMYNYVKNNYSIPKGYTNGGWKLPKTRDDYYDSAMGGAPQGVGATGGAWAFRRSAFDAVGGLMERCCLGHGDYFQSFSLVSEDTPDMHVSGYTKDYQDYLSAWQKNAARLKKNIGYVSGFCTHFWHGPKTRRSYSTRDLILVKHKFSPTYDLIPNSQGVLQLNPDKPALRDAIRQYFLSRSEDLPTHLG